MIIIAIEVKLTRNVEDNDWPPINWFLPIEKIGTSSNFKETESGSNPKDLKAKGMA